LLQKVRGGRGPAASGATAEFSQALGCLLTGGRFLVAKQDRLEDVPVLGLSGAPVLRGPNAKAAHDIFVKVPDSECSHWSRISGAVNRSNDSIARFWWR
jgi:hypothetical protein